MARDGWRWRPRSLPPRAAGFWKLVAALGFREVGIYEKHGQLDGVWRDIAIVEKLL